ncbi:MAG: hypothetical protein LC676_10950 [Loktanella sp.]|nr:hypothetical protein [Loktanella sp.]
MIRDDPEQWTPDLLEAQLIEAVQFAARTFGRTGPADVGSAMPEFRPTLDDFLENGWGLPEPPDEDEETTPALPSPAQVSRHMAALEWVADYLARDHPARARAVNAWIVSKATGVPFSKIIRRKGMQRSFAYTQRDRGLSLLSQILDERGVPVCPPER